MAKPDISLTRRRWLQASGGGLLALQATRQLAAFEPAASGGLVVGQPEGAAAGMRVLAEGGNAVDAAVAAALVAGVVAVSQCGIGGYGGHMVVGWPSGKVTALDFNSDAPAAAREDMFPLDARGRVSGAVNSYGWLAAGVPGTLAGLQLALDRFGTRRLSQVIDPAIGYAREGFPVTAGLARAIGVSAAQFQRDPGSASLFLVRGAPLAEGETFRNPALAAMLEKLREADSVASFYRGPIAAQIAGEFQKHGGLVTEQDLASYEAREVTPLELSWNGSTIYTAPLTAGGLSVLQALATLKSLGWERAPAGDPRTTHQRIEAMRLAWHDRLTLLGDPRAADVPVDRLLSSEYAEKSGQRLRQAVDRGQLIPLASDGRPAGGTVHLTAVDSSGMMVAVTLTHGEGFGARVTVEGLGLILGHGMSRFVAAPGHPNSPRARSRPLDNMCPTMIFRDNRPIAAMGATGGRRIPNTLCDVLVHLVGRGEPLATAAKAPRMHTEGDAKLHLATGWSDAEVEYLKRVGYVVTAGSGANFNGIARDPATGALEQGA